MELANEYLLELCVWLLPGMKHSLTVRGMDERL